MSLMLLVVLTGLGLLTPMLGAKIIGVALPERRLRLFMICLVLVVIVQAVSTALSIWNGHNMRRLGGRLVFDLRRKMYRHLHRLSLSFHEGRSTGEIMARLMNDVSQITTLITGTALNTIVAIFKAVAILIMLFCLNARVALLALIVMPLHYLSYFMFKRRLSHESWKSTEKTSQIYGKVNEVLGAAKMVKAYSSEPRETRTLIAQLREGYEIGVHAGLLSSIWSGTSSLISNWGSIIVMAVCGTMVILTARMTVERYVLLMAYVGMLYAPISQLIAVANQLIPAKIGMQRVFEILDMEPDIEDRPNGIRCVVKGKIDFQNVDFAYPNGKQVLNGVSFKAEPGQLIALVGPSGSGKTTIANLIARFYDRTDGQILIDGRDIQDYPLSVLRNQMSIVLQETYLFRGTVRENICYGRPRATDEEIVTAAKSANAHEFIEALVDGYDTLVGSKGARLSGGQRQRLAIARAIIRKPRILILDEATSSLDSTSEAKVKDALETIMRERTTFVIAHRLSTVRNADQILVMENGRIVEQGRHDELIAGNGPYRKLYDPEWAKAEEKREEEELVQLAA